MIIRVDGRLVKRDKPAILVETKTGYTFKGRRVELKQGDEPIGAIIQRQPDEDGPNGARVWIEIENDVEVTVQ